MDATIISESRFTQERVEQVQFAERNKNREARMQIVFERGQRRMLEILTFFFVNYPTLQEMESRITPHDVAMLGGRLSDNNSISRLDYLKAQISNEITRIMESVESNIYDVALVEYVLELRKLRENPTLLLSPVELREFEELMISDSFGKTYIDRIWGETGHYSILHDSLIVYVMNLLTGQKVEGVQNQRIMDEVQKARRRSKQLTTTETQRVKNQLSIREYKRLGYTHYVYVTEAGACPICEPLGNKIIPIDEAKQGENFPLKHPNCYCSTYGVIETRGFLQRRSNVDDHIAEFGSVKKAYLIVNRNKLK